MPALSPAAGSQSKGYSTYGAVVLAARECPLRRADPVEGQATIFRRTVAAMIRRGETHPFGFAGGGGGAGRIGGFTATTTGFPL